MKLEEIMQAAQAMQQQLADAQAKLDQLEVEGMAGGGLVRVRASAKGRVIGIAIDESLLEPGSREMLEDLVTAAFNDARAKADALAQTEMGKLTQGLPMPPGFKMPF